MRSNITISGVFAHAYLAEAIFLFSNDNCLPWFVVAFGELRKI